MYLFGENEDEVSQRKARKRKKTQTEKRFLMVSYHDSIAQELCGEHSDHLRELYVQNVPELA